jgi:hypothetical protein
MPKFAQKYMKPDFEFNKDLFEGMVWPVANSKGTDNYAITLEPRGFTCDCPGFMFRGKCKHTQQINDRIKEAVDGQVPQYETC